jgi:hypothetical protein
MSDDPFKDFANTQPPAVETPAKEKKKRKIPPQAVEAAPAPKKERKARKPRQAKEMRLPISTLLEIGSLSDEESGALLSIGAGLQKLPKKSRGKITAALSKIFG